MELKASVAFIVASFFVVQIFALPTEPASLVVSSTEKSADAKKEKEAVLAETETGPSKIYQLHVKSSVSNRFAHTTVTSRVKNVASKAQEATFSITLPESAFITGFIMEVEGKNYTAEVKEKEEARQIYEQAVSSGLGAGLVGVNVRDSTRFVVSVNVEPETKAAFYLTYEQLLKRQNGHYEQIINLYPRQLVEDFNVEVVIAESRKITDLKVPPIRSGNEIGSEDAKLDPRAKIEVINETAAVIRFSPNLETQKQLAHALGAKESDGLSGQFVVQYDVERDPKGGEVLVRDGYFVHFFAPSGLVPLPKHVVFVLDTSGSMSGEKIDQLKQAMFKILEQLHDGDLFSIVEFNSLVKVWDLTHPDSSVLYPFENLPSHCAWSLTDSHYGNLDNYKFSTAEAVNADSIKRAKDVISNFRATGGTDIQTSLTVGLHLIKLAKKGSKDNARQPIVMFLTDGEPTIRNRDTDDILERITSLNVGLQKSPIFTLSFGDGADRKFLEKLALQNFAFSRHIYEAADAALQLQDFYNQISSPLLTDVVFNYESSVTSLSKTEFPLYFEGSEIVVVGWCGTKDVAPPSVESRGLVENTKFVGSVEQAVTSVERLWAYLTVKQLLEEAETAKEKEAELKKKALDISLKYKFVTPVSSLVVVKPNQTATVATGETGSFEGNVALSQFDKNAVYAVESSPTMPPIPLYQTTPFCIELIVRTTEKPDITDTLPWLNDVAARNGTITLPSGQYNLGLNETISDRVACTQTPGEVAGHCMLVQTCTELHSLLTSEEEFIKHSCILKDKFVGVCCPDSP